MKRRAITIAASIAPLRRLMLLAVVLAVSLQAYFVQTHIHGRPMELGSAYAVSVTNPAAPLPADPMDPAVCKLCQELVHAAPALVPGGPGLTLLVGWVALAIPLLRLPAPGLAPPTGWQSRAPPRR